MRPFLKLIIRGFQERKGQGALRLRRIVIVLSLLVLILVGCTQKMDGTVDQINNNKPAIVDKDFEQVFKTHTISPEKFHFVADWLTDTKIVFVEMDESVYYVKTFDVKTAKIETLFEEASIIVDVLIHPSKKALLLHTSTDSASAIVKIISTDGALLDEVSIASSELEIEWNDLDQNLVLLTAFYQDWNYDVFLYDGKEGAINLISIDDPFPKWLGTDEIVSVSEEDNSLEGGNLHIYNHETNKRERSPLEKVLFVDTYEESLLTVQLDEEENALHTISTQDGSVISNWTMPVVSNYGEWFFPEVSWVSSNAVILPSVEEGGQLDDLRESYMLVRVTGGQQQPLSKNVVLGPLSCSPNGEKCLTGISKEHLIDMKTTEELIWLLLPN